MDLSTWIPFFMASVAISLSPGPGAMAAMSAGLNHGFRAGRVIALGLLAGVWTQLLVVGVGLGALLATSSLAFSVVKWVGAVYLIWLGLAQWRAAAQPLAVATEVSAVGTQRATRRALIWRGWTVNAVNPKGTIFLLAVLPQFIDASRPLTAQYLTVAATFGVVECVVMTGYAALAARALRFLQTPRRLRWMNRGFGGLFMVAGCVLATFRRAV